MGLGFGNRIQEGKCLTGSTCSPPSKSQTSPEIGKHRPSDLPRGGRQRKGKWRKDMLISTVVFSVTHGCNHLASDTKGCRYEDCGRGGRGRGRGGFRTCLAEQPLPAGGRGGGGQRGKEMVSTRYSGTGMGRRFDLGHGCSLGAWVSSAACPSKEISTHYQPPPARTYGRGMSSSEGQCS